MASAHILIISNDPTFCHSLNDLSDHEGELEFITKTIDLSNMISQMDTIPRAVIWDDLSIEKEEAWQKISLLQATPEVKVIDLNLERNEFMLYHAGRGVIEDIEDLLKLVKQEFFQSRELDALH